MATCVEPHVAFEILDALALSAFSVVVHATFDSELVTTALAVPIVVPFTLALKVTVPGVAPLAARVACPFAFVVPDNVPIVAPCSLATTVTDAFTIPAPLALCAVTVTEGTA
jgi:hypothetical protein